MFSPVSGWVECSTGPPTPTADDKLTDDDESDWSDSEGDSQSNQGEESLESDELLSND